MGDLDDTPAFRGLEAETDFREKPLGSSSRSKISIRSNGGRKNAERSRGERSDERDRNRSSSRSLMDSRTRDLAQIGEHGPLSREESVARVEDEVFDTASSPSKP